jgi:Mg-chelatase subunit ChlD
VRTGAVSYNSAMQTPTNLAWGETATKTYISKLTADGGTDSSIAFKTAYQALTAATENTAHMNVNGQAPSKYIVFMTDGDNNYTSADTETKKWCDLARTNGVEVYTVAFMAPDRGKALLSYCATTSAHYFAAENADDLNAAFDYIGERATETATRLTQ